jgi:phosphoribosylformylglycinamidine synthase
VVVLGGPAMLIGLGGGAASSVASGQSAEDLDFASVQRDNPEMQRRCQEVIDRCWRWATTTRSCRSTTSAPAACPTRSPSCCTIPASAAHRPAAVPSDDPGCRPMQLWCNEAQERYVLGVRAERLAEFAALCRRERCPFAVVGTVTADEHLCRLGPQEGARRPGRSTCRWTCCSARRRRCTATPATAAARPGSRPRSTRRTRLGPARGRPARAGASRPSRPSSFLVTIGDRSRRRPGRARPDGRALAAAAGRLRGDPGRFRRLTGEAMAIGERTPLALLDAAAAARMAVGEALTNLPRRRWPR